MKWGERMLGIGLFVIVIILLGVAVGVLAGWAKKKEKKGLLKGIFWGFVVFFACFNFPIGSEKFPAEWHDYIRFFYCYAMTALGLHAVYGEDRGPSLYPRLVLFTALGMGCRYLMEFGEFSNTYNFTLFNIVVYLFAAPIVTLLVYEFSDKAKRKEE